MWSKWLLSFRSNLNRNGFFYPWAVGQMILFWSLTNLVCHSSCEGNTNHDRSCGNGKEKKSLFVNCDMCPGDENTNHGHLIQEQILFYRKKILEISGPEDSLWVPTELLGAVGLSAQSCIYPEHYKAGGCPAAVNSRMFTNTAPGGTGARSAGFQQGKCSHEDVTGPSSNGMSAGGMYMDRVNISYFFLLLEMKT